MNIILTAGILLIIVSLATEKKYKPYIGFAFVFLIMGFQSGVEGDVMNYQADYETMAQALTVDSRTIEDEPVFPYLMKFFTFFSPYWFFVMVLSIFQVYILERFVSRFCKGSYQLIAAILFFFSFNMMLLQMKAMRQGFAIELIVTAFLLLEKNKKHQPVVPLLLTIVAFFIPLLWHPLPVLAKGSAILSRTALQSREQTSLWWMKPQPFPSTQRIE